MESASRFTKYKFLQGVHTFPNKVFDKLEIPTATVDGNICCANSKFVAVSFDHFSLLNILHIYRCHGSPQEAQLLSFQPKGSAIAKNHSC